MDLACSNGHLEIVKWLHENRNEGPSMHALDLASQNNHSNIIEWLLENRKEFS